MTHRGFGWRHNYAMINNIQMHYVEQAAEKPAAESATGNTGDKGTVVFCHGFPMLWFSWHRQIPGLAAAGYRVIAPSMRGMGQSEAPEEPEAYGVDEITAESLAEKTGRSVPHFNRLFRKVLRLSPMEYVLSLRVQEAQRLLATTGMSLGEIAAATGFYDQSHFTKRFRKVTGLTPSEYRPGVFA